MSRWLSGWVTVAVLLLGVAHGISQPFPQFPLDDPYITLHNAEVLLAGSDPNYVGVSPLSGTTSAVHLLLLLSLIPFIPPLWALFTAAWLGVLAYALGILRLARQHQVAPIPALLLVALGLAVAESPHQLLNGLETGWAMAAVVWSLCLASRPAPSRILPLLCGVLPFVRPELALLAILLLTLQAWRRWEGDATAAAKFRAVGQDFLLALLAALPWLLWYGIATGHLYPETIEAKRLFFAEGDFPLAVKAAIVGRRLLWFLGLLGLGGLFLFLLPATRLGVVTLCFLVGFVDLYTARFPGALSHNGSRYLYVLVPLLLYGAVSGLALPHQWQRWATSAVLAAALVQSLVLFPARWERYVAERERYTDYLQSVAAWCRAHLPAHEPLLVHDAGYIAWATSSPLVDLVGLKTVSSIADHRTFTAPSRGLGRGEALSRIASRSGARYLIVLADWERIFKLAEGLRYRGWGVNPLRRGGYTVYRLTPPP